jgi:geranylgeranyl reductase family protein
MLHDVIVAGAGPAGSYAAYLLARSGAAVALLDKSQFPREKPCGGALSRKALDLIDFDLSPVVHARAVGAWVTFGERAVRRDANGIAAAMTVRSELDAFLVERAVAAGARFHPGAALLDVQSRPDGVGVATAQGELRARYLFAADGVGSTVRARVFGKRAVEYAPAVEALIYAPPDLLVRFTERVVLELAGMPRGYGWIFGKRDHLNVGVFSIHGASGLRAHLAAFVARHPELARCEHVRHFGAPIPVRNAIGEFERGRVWLLGDAAGFAEAVLGEGIYFALKSGDLAARAFLDAKGEPSAGCYTRRLRREVLPELAASRLLARWCYAHPRFVFERIACSSYAGGLFLGLVTGDVGYRECLVKTAATFPWWLSAPRIPASELPSLAI